MAEFATSASGMTVVRSGESDRNVTRNPGPTSGPASTGGHFANSASSNAGAGLSSPYATQTTPVNVEPKRNEPVLSHHNQNKIRSLPISDKLNGVLIAAATASGVDEIRVMSGGQRRSGVKGIDWTGSNRHNNGNAADIDLYVNGRKLQHSDENDRPVFEKFISTAVGLGAQGVGAGPGYMGGRSRIHVGFGSSVAWGKRGASRFAPQWLKDAHKTGVDTPLSIEDIVPGGVAMSTERPDDPFGVKKFKEGVPDPNLRPDLTQPARGAAGARGGPTLSMAPAPMPTSLGAAIIDDRRILERGWKGDAVRELQEFLGWSGIPVDIDGDYGRQTRAAVKEYQRRSDIGVDGRVGPETYQAILYDIDPGSAVMPGQAAYSSGKRSAKKVVDPTYADIPLPTPAPERVVDIQLPKPRMNSRRVREAALRDQTPEAVSAMIQADAIIASMLASNQRLTGSQSGQRDRLRVPPEAASLGIGEMAVRVSETIRETARGIGDSYREAIERKILAAGRSDPEAANRVVEAALSADPNAANTVVDTYVFGPAGDPGAIADAQRYQKRKEELAARQRMRDIRFGRVPETGNSTVPFGS